MVPLPLFKLAALFVRHISKYGANQIKAQAHDHPRFRAVAARYGQAIHQLNMRANVALLRNPLEEIKAKEKAEAATVQTKDEFEKEQEKKRKATAKDHEPGSSGSSGGSGGGTGTGTGTGTGAGTRPNRFRIFTSQSVWRRKFRPLPEAKAVDLFADVVGDTFILGVAGGLIIYESWKAMQKPDNNLERIKALDERFQELEKREEALEKEEAELLRKVTVLEEALRGMKDPKTKKPLLPPLAPPSAA